jgi:hypothetical protein
MNATRTNCVEVSERQLGYRDSAEVILKNVEEQKFRNIPNEFPEEQVAKAVDPHKVL